MFLIFSFRPIITFKVFCSIVPVYMFLNLSHTVELCTLCQPYEFVYHFYVTYFLRHKKRQNIFFVLNVFKVSEITQVLYLRYVDLPIISVNSLMLFQN